MLSTAPAPFVELPLSVKTYDVDFAGIVSNIVYVRWLEDLRLALLDEVYPLRRALAEDVAPILTETRIRYRHPLTIQHRPNGRLWVTRVDRMRWRVAAEFVSADDAGALTTHATAEQAGLFIRLSTRRPVPVPGLLRERFAP